MLKVKKLMCLLSCILLFNIYNTNVVIPVDALETEVVKDKNIKIVPENKIGLIKNPIEVQYEKTKQEELEKQKLEEEQLETQNNESEWQEFILTFYTSLESENSSAGPVTCQNKPLSPGGVANNVIPQNTKLYLEGYGQVVVNDKGSDKYFSVPNRLDVFVERECGENDTQYSKRVNSYGIQKVRGYIV
jgi:3D (Asp-Asp-Asp) domain-containing protein